MTNLDAVKRVIMEMLRPDECVSMTFLVVEVRQRLGCTPNEARFGTMKALMELCEVRKVETMREGFRRKYAQSPPYVFPDRKPTFYDSDRRNDVWVVGGPTHTDGTGWNWEKRNVDILVAGDIWVPIHALHSEPIDEIAERSRQLQSSDTQDDTR